MFEAKNSMKRVAVGLALVSYLFMACGNLLDADCCLNGAAHAAGEHPAHQHAHSKALAAVHGLLHTPGPGAATHLAARHCCCLSQGEQELGLPPHAVTRQCQGPGSADLGGQAILPEGIAVPQSGAAIGSCHLSDNLATAFFRSVHSPILLI